MAVRTLYSTLDSEFSRVIEHRDCDCYSHNGFLTRRGYEMRAASEAAGLTGPPQGVRLDESVSVSAPETEAELASIKREADARISPPGSSEVTDHG